MVFSPPRERKLPGLIVLLAALAGLITAAVLIFAPFISSIVLALVTTTVAYPLHGRIRRWVGERRRGTSAALTCLVLIVLVFAPLTWIGWTMVKQAPAAAKAAGKSVLEASAWAEKQEWFPDLSSAPWYHDLKSFLTSVVATHPEGEAAPAPPAGEPGGSPPPAAREASEPQTVRDDSKPQPAREASEPPINGTADDPSALDGVEKAFPLGVWLTQKLGGLAAQIVADAFQVLLKFILFLLILFYFLKDGEEILRSAKKGVPLDERYQDKVVATFRQVTQSIIRGSFCTALAQGVVAAVAFAIVGLPAVFWGVMTMFCALIPPVGTSLVMIPLSLSLFIQERWGSGIFLVVVSLLVGTLDNILRPLLVGGSLRMHPIWLLLSILGAMRLFGPLGLVYGPMVLVLLGTFIALFVREEARGAVG